MEAVMEAPQRDAPLLESIAAFCRRSGIAESTFGRRAVNDGKLTSRLRNGGRITTETLDRIRTFQAQYASRNRGKFGTFDELITASGLDEGFRGERPVVNGYVFTLTIEEPSAARPAFYKVNADPQVAEGITATGNRHFYTDSSLGTIKATSENRPATAEDPSI